MESTRRSSRAPLSPRSRLRQPAAFLVLLAAGAGFLSCGDAAPDVPTILLVVNVPVVPAGTQSIEVRATLKTDPNSAGVTDPAGIHITNNKNKFAVVLPNAAPYVGSLLELNAYALDGSLCYRQSGTVSTTLTAGVTYQELSLQFTAPTDTPLCQLTVDVTGVGGTVVSAAVATGGSINCGKGNDICSSGFAQNSMVTLSGPDDINVYPVWSSNCVATNYGAAKCNINVTQGEQRVSVRFVQRSCGQSPGGWCQYNPYPIDFAANSMWGTGPTDVWSVGTGAEIMHYTTNGWGISASATDDTMTKVWGTGTTDVWALGNTSLIRYDGTKWNSELGSAIGNFETGASVSPTDVWVSGDSGRIVHYDGSAWTSIITAPAALSAMVAKNTNDLWAIDVNGKGYHFDGKTLTADTTLALAQGANYSLYVASSGEVWAATSAAVANSVWRYSGDAWSAVPADSGVTLDGGINAISGDTSMQIVFATADGQVLRYAGTTACTTNNNCWSSVYKRSPALPLRAVFANNASDVWAGGGFPEYVHYDGTKWLSTQPLSGSNQNLSSVWGAQVPSGTTPSDLWMVGNQTTYLSFDTVSIRGPVSASKPNRAIYGVSGLSQLEMWSVGDQNSIYRSTDGVNWATLTSGPPPPMGAHNYTGVYMTTGMQSARHYFLVGDNGYVGHYDPTKLTWSTMSNCGLLNLRAIHGGGGITNVFAVGANGVMYPLDANTNMCLAPVATLTTVNLNSVYVDGTRAWVVGDGNTVLAYTLMGTKLSTLTVPAPASDLNGVVSVVTGGNSIMVVGDNGTILGCTTTACTAQRSGITTNLSHVWAENNTDVWAVGDAGVILRWKM